jgi:hypothetical protein
MDIGEKVVVHSSGECQVDGCGYICNLFMFIPQGDSFRKGRAVSLSQCLMSQKMHKSASLVRAADTFCFFAHFLFNYLRIHADEAPQSFI